MIMIDSQSINLLLQRTLNYVDPRLVDHGKRVAWLVWHLLDTQGGYSIKEQQDICFLAMLHDIGAYKTEEIDQMVHFETENVWEHSIYGYLFLKYLSPLKDLAPAILFHHAAASMLAQIDVPCKHTAQLINLTDRVDVYLHTQNSDGLREDLEAGRGSRFDPSVLDLFWEADRRFGLVQALCSNTPLKDPTHMAGLSREDASAYITMLVYAIDFRSQYTLTHTLTTTSIADELARLMDLPEEERNRIHYGATLHDLGKVGIPVEILESPGRLSAQAMAIMRTHVEITEKILGQSIDPIVTRIALRHHEKLDGSGYPRGLRGEELTEGERIVAVADITSALLSRRSYKEAFSPEQTLALLRRDAAANLLDPRTVAVLDAHFVQIMGRLKEQYAPVLQLYQNMNHEYDQIWQRLAGSDIRQSRSFRLPTAYDHEFLVNF